MRQGKEALIVKPFLVEAVEDGASAQFVYGHGGQEVHGDAWSLHASLDDAFAALWEATDHDRVSGTLDVHSEGELRFLTSGFRL